MKVGLAPGEFCSKALVKEKDGADVYSETYAYFFSWEEINKYYDPAMYDVKWPIEVYENGFIYVPSKEELEEK